MKPSNDRENTRQLFKAYKAKSPQEVADCYDTWAEEYETHMANVGYLHPALVAASVTRYVPTGAGPILDAGAGTGIMAQILVALGYPGVFGFDASKSMLAAAAAKNVLCRASPWLPGPPPRLSRQSLRRRGEHWRVHPGPRTVGWPR